MIEVNATLGKIEAMKKSLKIGDKVIYNTPVAEFSDDNKKSSSQSHKAKIVKKLEHLAVIEYNISRGKNTTKEQSTMTYKEIYFQRKGFAW